MTKPPVRRMVIFMSGFDPVGPERYYSMLQQQIRYYTKRFSAKLKLGTFERNQIPNSYFSKTAIEAEWPEGNCSVEYLISDWHDSVLEMENMPFWKRSFLYLVYYFGAWLSGTYPKILKYQKRFAIVFSIPLVCLLIRLGIYSLSIFICTKITNYFDWHILLGVCIGLLIAAGIIHRMKPLFVYVYEKQIAGSLIFQSKLTVFGNTKQKERSRLFSEEIISAIKTSKPEEVLILSHSFGWINSLPLHIALNDHFRQENERPHIVQVSIGSMFPFSLIYRPDKKLKNLARTLLLDPDCHWVDFYAEQDPFNIPYADIKEDFGVMNNKCALAKHETRTAAFEDIFAEKKMRMFRFNPLRKHFQFLAANDHAGGYDFFRMIAHPSYLKNDLNLTDNTEI